MDLHLEKEITWGVDRHQLEFTGGPAWVLLFVEGIELYIQSLVVLVGDFKRNFFA